MADGGALATRFLPTANETALASLAFSRVVLGHDLCYLKTHPSDVRLGRPCIHSSAVFAHIWLLEASCERSPYLLTVPRHIEPCIKGSRTLCQPFWAAIIAPGHDGMACDYPCSVGGASSERYCAHRSGVSPSLAHHPVVPRWISAAASRSLEILDRGTSTAIVARDMPVRSMSLVRRTAAKRWYFRRLTTLAQGFSNGAYTICAPRFWGNLSCLLKPSQCKERALRCCTRCGAEAP